MQVDDAMVQPHFGDRAMSFRRILACLNETASNGAIIGTASILARDFDAGVTGLYVVPAAPVYPEARYEPIPEMFEAHREYFRRRSVSVQAAFKAGFSHITPRPPLLVENSVSPLIGDVVIERGRYFDLILLSETDMTSERGVELDFVPRVAVAAGRPVLVVPSKAPWSFVPETVVIGWNGSREAARAAFDSLPLLKRAKTIHVVWVDPPPDSTRPGTWAEDIVGTLDLHGIRATAASVKGCGKTAGEVLLETAADSRAGLLVIGAYGHSRLSEFILGGVTRTVLREMKCSVLLSH
jgi:nucleotide-binding universal stress UspA family protein